MCRLDEWKAIQLGEAVYDLGHLHLFSYDLVVPDEGDKPIVAMS